jgi:hypothetical protein
MAMTQQRVVLQHEDPRHHVDFPALASTASGEVVLLARRCGPWAYDATFKFGRPLTFFERDAELVVWRAGAPGGPFTACGTLFRGLAYDPMLYRLRDGRLLAGAVVGEAGSREQRATLRGVLHRHLPLLDTVITVRGFGLWFSEDDGRTWSAEPQVVSLPGWENVYNLRRAFELPDGTLILPVAVGYPWRTRYVGLLRSWDLGATWSDPSFVAEDPAGRAHYAAGVGYWEPAMEMARNGNLVCLCVLDDHSAAPTQRPQGSGVAPVFGPQADLPRLWCTHSVDSGFTWSLPQDTGLRGDFPSLLALPGGELLLTFTQRRPDGASVLAYRSPDGVTWTPERVLCEATDDLFYYPQTIAVGDGSLVTSCMVSQPDQVRVVATLTW